MQGNKEQLERRLHPQNRSQSAIVNRYLGTRTRVQSNRSIAEKARAPSDEQPKEGSLGGRSACKCRAEPLQQHVTQQDGPLRLLPIVPAQHSPSQPVLAPSRCFPQQQGRHTPLRRRELTEVQDGAGAYRKTSLGSKAITYRARVLPDPQATRSTRSRSPAQAVPRDPHMAPARTPRCWANTTGAWGQYRSCLLSSHHSGGRHSVLCVSSPRFSHGTQGPAALLARCQQSPVPRRARCLPL